MNMLCHLDKNMNEIHQRAAFRRSKNLIFRQTKKRIFLSLQKVNF